MLRSEPVRSESYPRHSVNDRLFTLRVRLGLQTIMVYAYDARRTDHRTGHSYIDISVTMRGQVVFPRGQLYCGVNRWTSLDCDAAKRLVLETVAMKPGDTDSEYFVGYTDEQIEFATQYGEELSLEAMSRYGEA
jgi:hypothetical protein